MTINITLECDGNGCGEETSIESEEVLPSGWGYDGSDFHYCPQCWPVVQEELAESSNESESQ